MPNHIVYLHRMANPSKQRTKQRLASSTRHHTKRSKLLQRYDTFNLDLPSLLKRGTGQMGLGTVLNRAERDLGVQTTLYFILFFATHLSASSQLLCISILCLPLAPRLFDMATDIKDKTVLRHVESLSSKLRRRYASAIFASRMPLTMFQSTSRGATSGDGNNSPYAPHCIHFKI